MCRSTWPPSRCGLSYATHPLLPLSMVADRNRGAAFAAMLLASVGMFRRHTPRKSSAAAQDQPALAALIPQTEQTGAP